MTAVAIAATPSRARTWWLLPALVIAVGWSIASWAAVPYTVGVFHDDGVYALLARSIAAGDGFHYSHLPGAPAATHYPPLYPLLLAAAWRIMPAFPENISFLLGINALLLGIAAYGWVVFAKGRLGWSPRTAAVAALVATLSTPVLTVAGALLSEPMFIALLWPSLLLCERSADDGDGAQDLWTGALVGLLMLVRTHAIALFVAVFVVLVARRRYVRAGTVFLAAFVVQLPWLLWSRWASPSIASPLQGAYGSYLSWVAAGVRDGGIGFPLATARVNLIECWLLLQDRFAAGMPAAIHHLTLAIVVAAMLTGIWSIIRRAPVTIVFAVLYLGIVLVFPFTPWRYVWAIWPLLALMMLEGGRALWLRAGRWRIGVAVCALLPALAFLRTELHAYATRSWRVPARQASAEIAPALDWVRTHTTAHDVVLGAGEQVIALYTGRESAPPISITAREYLVPPTVA
ncbi:MAG: hypothetical protein JWL61_3302, partial [Gemmatimonadetes bacterium]|nr:hypothetical protein [Gemmatimonadota bacterium]